MINCKSERELAKMRLSGRVTARALDALKPLVQPGISTKEIDAAAEREIRGMGAEPAFLGYHGFTGSICASVNDEVVHGIPGERKLREGDILKIDIGAVADGWYSDMAYTLPVGRVSAEASKLIEVTQASLYEGIRAVRPGGHVSDVGSAVQAYVERHGFAVVRALVGHGVGKHLHEDPAVPNFGRKGGGAPLKRGMVLAIEPMVNAGTFEVRTKDDQWTVVTADGRLSAHFEHTVAVVDGGYEILTLTEAEEDAGPKGPAPQEAVAGGKRGAT
jgi:methionyl aminopeptidase